MDYYPLYAMGHDSVIPKKVFSYIHPKFQTPTYNILLINPFLLSALFVDLVTAVSFINFGVLVAFLFMNLSVIAYYFVKKRKRSYKRRRLHDDGKPAGGWNLQEKITIIAAQLIHMHLHMEFFARIN